MKVFFDVQRVKHSKLADGIEQAVSETKFLPTGVEGDSVSSLPHTPHTLTHPHTLTAGDMLQPHHTEWWSVHAQVQYSLL